MYKIPGEIFFFTSNREIGRQGRYRVSPDKIGRPGQYYILPGLVTSKSVSRPKNSDVKLSASKK